MDDSPAHLPPSAPAPGRLVGAARPRVASARPRPARARPLGRNCTRARLSGAGALAFGVVVLVWPELTIRTFVLLFGVYAIGQGAIRLLVALVQRRGAIGASLLLDALAGIGAGIALLVWPRASAAVLFYLVAFAMVFTGLAGVAVGSSLRWLVAAQAVVLGLLLLIVALRLWRRPTAEYRRAEPSR